MILGFGVDLCDIARIRRALEGPASARFLARVFTEGERAYCEARRKTRFASYAARFAAKEAAMKALGTGWGQGVAWREFEVVRRDGGPPTLRLHGEAAARARRLGMVRWLLTLSHAGEGAIAAVVAEGTVRRAGAGPRRRRAAGAGSARRRPRARR